MWLSCLSIRPCKTKTGNLRGATLMLSKGIITHENLTYKFTLIYNKPRVKSTLASGLTTKLNWLRCYLTRQLFGKAFWIIQILKNNNVKLRNSSASSKDYV